MKGEASVARRRNRNRKDAEKSLDELIATRERARKAGGATCKRYNQLSHRIYRFKQKMEGGNNTKNVAIGKAKGREAKGREAMGLQLEKAERKLNDENNRLREELDCLKKRYNKLESEYCEVVKREIAMTKKFDELAKTQAKQANQIDNTTVVVEEIWI